MTLSPTTEGEVKSIIKELKTNKNNKNELAKPLCDLINLVLQSGTFPDILKTAKIIPIYNKGGSLECDNYCQETSLN